MTSTTHWNTIINERHMRDGAVERIDHYYRWMAETKIDIHSGDGFDVQSTDLHPSTPAPDGQTWRKENAMNTVIMNLPTELRGVDLTPGQMDACSATLRRYQVEALP